MRDASIENSWTEIEALTQVILTAASNQQWDEVLALSSRRHLELQDHFAVFPVGPEKAEFYRTRIDTMLRGESELQKIISTARKALMAEGLSVQMSNRAVGAYLSAAINR